MKKYVFPALILLASLLLPGTVRADSLIESSTYYGDESLTEVSLPEDLTVLGDYNIYDCSNLKEVTVPASVSYISNNCFYSCNGLTQVTFLGPVPHFGPSTFEYLPEDLVILVPDDQLEQYQAALPDYHVEGSGQPAVTPDLTAPEDAFTFDAATRTITGYSGDANYLKIPASIGGTAVKAIGPEAFNTLNCLAWDIAIPEGVETIGEKAFSRLPKLKWVEFPSTLRTIEESAFEGYMGYEVGFNEGLETIGKGAFARSGLMGELHFPEGLKKISARAFQGSFRITDLYFPESIRSIGKAAFEGTGVNYLVFAGTEIPKIAETAFEGLSLADVDMNPRTTKESVQTINAFFQSIGQSPYVWRMQNPEVDYDQEHMSTYENGLLTGYTGTASHIRPWDTFDDITVTGIADGALKGNQVVTYFAVCYNDHFATIGEEAFADSVLETVDLFDSVTTIGREAFRNCINMKEIVLPESVTEIGDGAFKGCTGLTEITLPASLTSVGENIFEGCENLAKVVVKCDTAVLPDTIFAGCAAIEADPSGVVLAADVPDAEVARLSAALGLPWYQPLLREGESPRELVAMPFEATDASLFEFDPETGTITGYTGKEADVVVPREIDGVTVRAIDYNAFGTCRDYTDTDMVSNQTIWTHLRSVILPETVTKIADSAFSYCQQLESFICYGPAVSTGRATFTLCRNLREVIFVNGVGMIDNYCFEGTDLLETVYTPLPISYLGESAFVNSGIREFVVNATRIGYAPFWNCAYLTELHITDAVKEVSGVIANNCTSLYKVCFETTDLSFIPNDGLIAGAEGVVSVTLPEGIDETNREKADHILVWGGEAETAINEGTCDRTPAELPDIAAILDDYAANPYIQPEPETEPEPETFEAVPVGEAGKPFLGTWKATDIVMGDTTYKASDINMEMVFTLNADGTCEFQEEEGGTSVIPWMVNEDGSIFLLDSATTLTEDGRLLMSDEGIELYFEHQ